MLTLSMPGFHRATSFFEAVCVFSLLYSVGIRCAKVGDLTPRIIKNNVLAPHFDRLRSSGYSISDLKRKAGELLNRSAATPVSTTLCATSLLVSSPVWLGLVPAESLVSRGMPKSPTGCCLPLTSSLLIPEFNGGNILNLISFYMLLRQTEVNKGSEHLLKRVVANLVNNTVVSHALGSYPDFHKFSRAVTVTNAMENPHQRVQFQGIMSLKQWHLPLALLLADYLVTLRPEQAIEGFKATVAGAMTYVMCNKL